MTPIMVVCFTNHALDQFMEGLLKYTNKIVRAGGGSKSENLSIYNLRNLRKVWRQKRSLLKDLEQSNYKDMKRAAETIKMIQLNLEEINKKKGIISLELLHKQQVINDHCYDIFKDNVLDYVEWLLPQNENVNLMENDEGNMGIIEDVDRRNFNRELLKNYVRSRSTYAISINSLNFLQKLLESEIIKLKNNDHLDQNCKLIQLCQQLRDIVYKRDCLLQRSKEIDIEDVSEIKRVRAIPVKNLNLQERWMLYRYWISKLKDSFIRDLEILGESFKECARKYDETSLRIDFEIMRNASVVGMTTTYAAKSKSLLEALKPKIVFVEEAAEVLESHIIVSVTKHCQHLILAGDHQQLRPSTSVYKLAKDYKLDISLFERMLNNGMHCEVLKVQHRMRPEIASLISPSIYPELHNHQDVKHYKKILGVKKSLFFIDHTHPDEQVGDSFSKKNEHEGQFLIALCRHLIMQGYETNAITILATYTAQMLYLKNLSKQYKLLQNVHITVVDNFQGEESDIVLLSLVRSNEKGIIGFLKIENRVCVALSRAKKGMYIMGNMKNLTQSSDIWPKINETLQQQESIGKELELQCQKRISENYLQIITPHTLDAMNKCATITTTVLFKNLSFTELCKK
ncbi:hypothetical protein C0J52_07667 [Blattella germanica]|nr:hypothetical protein C0J52_07667 [Blattella germanica]